MTIITSYRGFLMERKEGILTMKLSRSPKIVFPKIKRRKKVFYLKNDLLVTQKIALTDIESIRLVEKKKEAIAVIGDTVGLLSGLAAGTILFFGVVIKQSRPDLVRNEVIPLSILGLGLSYLLTRIGHGKKYRTKPKRKGKYTHWIIKN